MENDWASGKLGDFITFQRGFDLPAYERQAGDVPVITSSGISDYHSESKVKGPGVIIGRYGSIGNVYYVEQDFWPHNTSLFVKDFKGNHPRFISYYLRTLNYQIYNDKSSVPGINRNHLHLLHVLFPPFPEQCAIAELLGSLDDKIELNRRMNVTLEEMARAVFKEWFVDRDEVESWEAGTIGDIADNIRIGALPQEVEQSTPYIGLEHMPRQSIALSEWGTASDVKSNKFRFNQGEFLFGKLRPYFHKVGVAPLDGVCSTDILVIAPKSPEWYGLVLFHLSSSLSERQ